MNRQLLSLLPLLLQTLLLVLPLPLAQGGSGQVDTSGFPEVWYCDKNKRCGMIQQQPWLDRPPDERLGIGSELVDVDPDGGYHMLIEKIGKRPNIGKSSKQHLTYRWCYTFGLFNDRITRYSVSNCCCEFFEHARCEGFLFSATNRGDNHLGRSKVGNGISSVRCHRLCDWPEGRLGPTAGET